MFIASEVRSGSTFVAETIAYALADLKDHSFWNLTKEPSNHLSADSDADEVRRSIGSLWVNKAGFRSAKFLCGQLSIMCREARADADLAEMMYGESAYWLILHRRDRMAQAVSLAFARSDGVYHAYAPDECGTEKVVRMEDVSQALTTIARSADFLDGFGAFPNRQMTVYYEDVVADPGAFLRSLCAFIEIDFDTVPPAYPSACLTPTQQGAKSDCLDQFRSWFVYHYYGAAAPAA